MIAEQLDDTIRTMLEHAARRFEAENPHLVPTCHVHETFPGAVSLQTHFSGAHTLTISCEVDPLTETAYKARLRAAFHDQDDPSSKRATSASGWFYATPDDGWVFTRGKNKTIRGALEAQAAFDFLASL